ncbi:uncharacterized protein MELLADRAFT_104570 [Melampsora larici-populina 98AG31]|uniref:Uncharacterized protein n=1 Tax=Melampsora larici-populina (strain 98AG31 / pathotype 3-4-7) TaxID=747676 RepID=F4RF57_MELLP|nr:uncharacterized protein MELLADRAFT_104570 [Melampsora larici-populina 98AG31]EGG08756.1 hypothetical protein MELLADRAFT_104570 [Melampsora larici-populina 98AG31]
MSNPESIDQFNTSVKRSSDRLRGGSATPQDSQSAELPSDTISATDANADKLSAGQGRKGKSAAAKKGPANAGNQAALPGSQLPGQNPHSSSAPATALTGDAPPTNGNGTTATSVSGTQVTSIPATERPPTTKAVTVPVPGSIASSTLLIAKEVINANKVKDAQLPPTAEQAAAIVERASGVLSRIDECLPEAIKSWLNSKGFALVTMAPGGSSTGVGGVNALDTPVESCSTLAPSNAAGLPASGHSATPRSCDDRNGITPKPSSTSSVKRALEWPGDVEETHAQVEVNTTLTTDAPNLGTMLSEAVGAAGTGIKVLEIAAPTVEDLTEMVRLTVVRRDVAVVMTVMVRALRGRQTRSNAVASLWS